MSRLTFYINQRLSYRLSLLVIGALASLLIVSLCIMFFFSRKALREEAIYGAAQSLDAMVSRIDNILLDVEQATGNVYFKMMSHLQQPEQMNVFVQRLVDENPYVTDAHIHWTTDPDSVDTSIVGWITPQQAFHDDSDAITTFRLPIFDGRKTLGAFDVSVSLTQLSKIMLEGKPSPHSFCVLLGKDGKIIIYPDSTFLNKNAFQMSEEFDHNSEADALHAMTSGWTGYKYVRISGQDCYVFYKPFVRAEVPGRAQIDLGWSAGIVYPEDDIFGDYNRLLRIVFIIAIVGLLLLFAHCRVFIHRQLVPLRQLEKSAHAITEGSYDIAIPDSHRQDEIGRLQRHFQQMQQSLATRMGELQRASDLLQERGEVLQAAYEQAQAGDRMKTNFLYNMSDQMTAPVGKICQGVMTLSEHAHDLSEREVNRLVGEIQKQGGEITDLLNQLISESEKINN